MSLRAVQRESVLDALRWGQSDSDSSTTSFGASQSAVAANTTAWRVLLHDANGRDMLGPLLNLKELREQAGVTVHQPLERPRSAVAGAPAVYLCMPTDNNVDAIASDVADGLFAEYRVQFLAAAPRPVLERLARGLQAVSSIHNVFVADRALSYVALQGDLFTVPNCDRICYAFNSKHLTEKALEGHVRFLAQSLAHVAAALSPAAPFVAFVRSAHGGAAEAVAQKLHGTLHDLVKDRSSNFFQSAGTSKCVFLIVDRMADVGTALHHHFSYRGLLADALGMRLNKVTLHGAAATTHAGTAAITGEKAHGEQKGGHKDYQVEPDADAFWSENAARDFRTVHEYVDAALASFRKEYNALMASEGISASGGDSAADLARLMQQAPKLAERKRSVDAHMTLAFQCLQSIKQRRLDQYHGVEQGLLHPGSVSLDTEGLEGLLKEMDTSKGGVAKDDIERLMLLCYLAGTDGGKKELLQYVEQYRVTLENMAGGGGAGAGASGDAAAASSATKPDMLFPSLAFLKKIRSLSVPGGGRGGASSSGAQRGWAFAQDLFTRLTSGSSTACPVTKVAESVHQFATAASNSSSSSSSSAADSGRNNLMFLDPRARDSSQGVGEHVLRAAGCNHLVVFVVGGVAAVEYEDLKAWADQKNVRWNITVGGTELLTGESLLHQLNDLGKE